MKPTARSRSRHTLVAVPVVAVALGLAACSSSSSPATGSPGTPAGGASGGTTVATASSGQYGTILVNSSGATLYMLTADSSTTSACSGSCVSIWAPLTTTGSPAAGSGADGSKLGTISRSDGSKQVTYNGHPLYTFSGDSGSGQVHGEGINSFGGTWYVLDAAGSSVTHAVTSSSSTSSGGGGGGYGY